VEKVRIVPAEEKRYLFKSPNADKKQMNISILSGNNSHKVNINLGNSQKENTLLRTKH
jgi:hypothetical protein